MTKNLHEKIDPKFWITDKVSSKHPDFFRLNKIIFDEITSLQAAFELDRKNGIAFTEAHVLQRMSGLDNNPAQDFYAFCRQQIRIKDYSSESKRTYLSEVTKMETFSPSLAFADITYSWLQKYEKYMRDKLINHPNTIWKSFKFVNTMLNAAIKVGGIIKDNPMKNYKRGTYKQGIPVYLEWSEVQKLHKAITTKPMTDSLRLIGYYGLLSCYAGLRFGDVVKFDYSKKVIEDSTGRRLVLYAAKNGEIVSIAFTSYITEVVEYIKERPIKITNQEFNVGVKSLRAIAGIEKDFSAHSFRHSFAMRLAELGISIEDAQKLMGHNKRSSTEIYYRVKSARLDAAMKKWE